MGHKQRSAKTFDSYLVYVLVFEGVTFYHHEVGRNINLSGFVLSMNMDC